MYGLDIVLIMLILFTKHFIIDFINQTNEEVESKGKYLEILGMWHSIKHGIATMIIMVPFCGFYWAIVAGLIDYILHYHIDYFKMRIGKSMNLNPSNKAFWIIIGLDQYLHTLTYMFIIVLCYLAVSP